MGPEADARPGSGDTRNECMKESKLQNEHAK